MGIDGLLKGFDAAHLGRSPAQFDRAQLMHWQKEAVHAASDEQLVRWLTAHDALGETDSANSREAFVHAVRDNIVLPADAAGWAARLFGEFELSHDARAAIKEAGADFFAEVAALVDSHAGFAELAKAVSQVTGCKGKRLYMPLRAALTGEIHGPEMARAYPLLASARVRERIESARRIAAGT
jgi:glutamyl-tRNA synthetase